MITIDARGDQCPIPVIKTKKAIEALTGSETILVMVDNEVAVQNVSKMAANIGALVSAEKKAEKEYHIQIQVGKESLEKAAVQAVPECESCETKGDFIVVVPSATMGVGNDELGKVLIKGFLFAVSQLETLPKKILFYNGGVTLTTEGSPALEDLKNMEAQGVEILSCGTCLDYYELKEKLAVGGITNMYVIVESMALAGKVIRP